MLFKSYKSASVAVLIGSFSVISAVAPSMALAQGDVEEIVVTGFRGSLEAALDQKRDSVNAVDSIMAEDIADFPDLNLAESLQRIPGVAITRAAGEGRQISVRGLGPQFTRVRVNGMETLATGGSTDAAGGTNRNRQFDFNTFASELFSSITVNKTAAAEVDEGSMGATVDLNTARPFDYDGFKTAVSAQLGYNDLSGETDPRIAVLISNTFNDSFGALLSVAHSQRTLKDEGASTVRWQNSSATPGTNSFQSVAGDVPYTNAQLSYAFRPRIPRYDAYEHDQERLGVTSSLQFKPSDATLISVDLLYSKFDATRQEAFLQSPNFSGALNEVDVLAAEIRGQDLSDPANPVPGTLVYGVFQDVDIRTENRFDELTTEYTQLSLLAEHDFSDSLRFKAQLGSSESDHDNPVQTTLLFNANNIPSYTFDYRANNRLPVITYGNTNLNNPATWTLGEIRLRPQTALNTFDTIKLDLAFDISDTMTVKGGVSQNTFNFVSTEKRRWNGTSTANIEGVIPGFVAAEPLNNYAQRLSGFGEGLGMPAVNPTSWLIPDVRVATDLFRLNDTSVATGYRMGIIPALGNNFNAEEKSTGVFAQLDFEFDLGVQLRGNVGVRSVETDLAATGYAFDNVSNPSSPLQTIRIARDYSDTLPSLNLVADITDDLLVRFGWAKVMTRPGLGTLNPGAPGFSVTTSLRTVTAQNPFLDPFRADTTDLAVEWYFAEEALLSVALFEKDIESFVQTVRTTFDDFSDNPFGIPDQIAINACGITANCNTNPGTTWDFSIPQNTPGGELTGFEISYQQPFSFLPGILSNFGAIVNYTSVDAEIQYVDSFGVTIATGSLLGLSESAYNVTLYYEDDKLSARVSAAVRDDYPTNIPGRNGAANAAGAPWVTGNDIEGTKGTTNIDMAVSYALSDNLKLSFEGINLTDEFEDQFIDSTADRLSYYHHTGKQYYVGFGYTY